MLKIEFNNKRMGISILIISIICTIPLIENLIREIKVNNKVIILNETFTTSAFLLIILIIFINATIIGIKKAKS